MSDRKTNTDKTMSRRRMLALLGITGAAAYATPTLLSLDQARASGGSGGGSGGSGGSGGRGSGGSGGSGGRGSGGRGRSVDAGDIFRPIRRIFS